MAQQWEKLFRPGEYQALMKDGAGRTCAAAGVLADGAEGVALISHQGIARAVLSPPSLAEGRPSVQEPHGGPEAAPAVAFTVVAKDDTEACTIRLPGDDSLVVHSSDDNNLCVWLTLPAEHWQDWAEFLRHDPGPLGKSRYPRVAFGAAAVATMRDLIAARLPAGSRLRLLPAGEGEAIEWRASGEPE